MEQQEGSFAKGFANGVLTSIPIWILVVYIITKIY